jgi:hypothetical protein
MDVRAAQSGEIHVIVGPMFAGKTTALLRRVQAEAGTGRYGPRRCRASLFFTALSFADRMGPLASELCSCQGFFCSELFSDERNPLS